MSTDGLPTEGEREPLDSNYPWTIDDRPLGIRDWDLADWNKFAGSLDKLLLGTLSTEWKEIDGREISSTDESVLWTMIVAGLVEARGQIVAKLLPSEDRIEIDCTLTGDYWPALDERIMAARPGNSDVEVSLPQVLRFRLTWDGGQARSSITAGDEVSLSTVHAMALGVSPDIPGTRDEGVVEIHSMRTLQDSVEMSPSEIAGKQGKRLRRKKPGRKPETKRNIEMAKLSNDGMSNDDLADRYKLSAAAVRKALERGRNELNVIRDKKKTD